MEDIDGYCGRGGPADQFRCETRARHFCGTPIGLAELAKPESPHDPRRRLVGSPIGSPERRDTHGAEMKMISEETVKPARA
jgi:hypothetical protein